MNKGVSFFRTQFFNKRYKRTLYTFINHTYLYCCSYIFNWEIYVYLSNNKLCLSTSDWYVQLYLFLILYLTIAYFVPTQSYWQRLPLKLFYYLISQIYYENLAICQRHVQNVDNGNVLKAVKTNLAISIKLTIQKINFVIENAIAVKRV